MKNKYIFGGFIIVVFLGLMGYLFTQSNIKYENNFAKVKTQEKIVKATGSWIKSKNYVIDKSDRTFTFYMSDEHGNEMKVVYDGTIPNNFETAKSVVVTGKYDQGYFHATNILTKCPSKYEGQNVQDVKKSQM
jgi:cytochrome c-type biogenesis protein CcmE